MSIMHVFVQCPRLNCLVRRAIIQPEDSDVLAAAVSLAEYVWQIDLPAHLAELLQTAVTAVKSPPCLDMASVLTETLHFDSVQSMVLCTRYWMLRNVLCGLTDTLHRHFPNEASLSLLPPPDVVRQFDIDAGVRLAESLAWAESVSQRLPLVPLRLHTPLQISIGPWLRIIQDINTRDDADTALDLYASPKLTQAIRMKTWLINECNRIHEQWNVSTVDEQSLCEALYSMAGERIPDWLPTRVRFEAEDGNMVIKLDYEKTSSFRQSNFRLADGEAIIRQPGLRSADSSVINDCSPVSQKIANSSDALSRSPNMELVETSEVTASSSLGAADHLFRSGRNLCSTSGWWPTVEAPEDILTTSTCTEREETFVHSTASSWWPQAQKSSTLRSSGVLLDSTHKTASFQPKVEQAKRGTAVSFDNRNMNGCMSPGWSDPSRFVRSMSPSDGVGGANNVSPERIRGAQLRQMTETQ